PELHEQVLDEVLGVRRGTQVCVRETAQRIVVPVEQRFERSRITGANALGETRVVCPESGIGRSHAEDLRLEHAQLRRTSVAAGSGGVKERPFYGNSAGVAGEG